MNQQKKLVGSSESNKNDSVISFLSISPKKEKIVIVDPLIGSNSNKSISSLKKTNLVGFETIPISKTSFIYKKSSLVGSVVEPPTDSIDITILKNVEHVRMLNDSYFPSPIFKTVIKVDPAPSPETSNPTFDSTTVTFDSEIITFDNSY